MRDLVFSNFLLPPGLLLPAFCRSISSGRQLFRTGIDPFSLLIQFILQMPLTAVQLVQLVGELENCYFSGFILLYLSLYQYCPCLTKQTYHGLVVAKVGAQLVYNIYIYIYI